MISFGCWRGRQQLRQGTPTTASDFRRCWLYANVGGDNNCGITSLLKMQLLLCENSLSYLLIFKFSHYPFAFKLCAFARNNSLQAKMKSDLPMNGMRRNDAKSKN
jgi:hypothetical protein